MSNSNQHKSASVLSALILATGLAGATLLAPASAFAKPVREVRAAKANGRVDVEVVATDLQIVGVAGTKVEIAGEIPDEWELEIKTTGDRTKIIVRPRKGHSRQDSQLTIKVPQSSNVRTKSVSGEVDVTKLRGDLSVEAVSGDVEASTQGSEVEIRTVSGDVKLSTSSSRTTVHAVSGDIAISGPRGVLKAKTVSGDITIEKASVSKTSVASTSGDIQLSGELTRDGPHEFKGHSGDIELKLNRSKPLEVSARSFSGTITDGFSGSKYEGRKGATFSIGKGGPPLELRTFSGEISVRPR